MAPGNAAQYFIMKNIEYVKMLGRMIRYHVLASKQLCHSFTGRLPQAVLIEYSWNHESEAFRLRQVAAKFMGSALNQPELEL
jgi:hypothetical protein